MSADTFRDRQRKLNIANEMRTCRHFTGIQHERCKADVRYMNVRDPNGKLGVREPFPCTRFATRMTPVGADCAIKCPARSFWTREEAERNEAESEAAVLAFIAKLNAGIVCPHCDKPITTREKVGRCLYARPCGHRLGQVESDEP